MVLPKIQKIKIISRAIEEQGFEYISCFQPEDLKLDPIVKDQKYLTKRLSNLSIFFTNLFCPKLKVMKKMILTFSKNARETEN